MTEHERGLELQCHCEICPSSGWGHDESWETGAQAGARMQDRAAASRSGHAAQFVAEASATLGRRGRGQPEDVWLKSPLYPDYYLNTFHYQVPA